MWPSFHWQVLKNAHSYKPALKAVWRMAFIVITNRSSPYCYRTVQNFYISTIQSLRFMQKERKHFYCIVINSLVLNEGPPPPPSVFPKTYWFCNFHAITQWTVSFITLKRTLSRGPETGHYHWEPYRGPYYCEPYRGPYHSGLLWGSYHWEL